MLSLNFPLMNFLFMPDNLVTHSSVKCSVSPFFLVISVFSHQPHLLHLCCCLQLHRAGCTQTVLRGARWQYTSMACANFLWNPRTKHFHCENGQALQHLAREVVLCTHSLQIGRIWEDRLSATWAKWSCFKQGVGLDGPPSSIAVLIVLGFYEVFKNTFSITDYVGT